MMSDKATLIERLREEANAMQNELEKSDSTGWPVSVVAGLLGVARIEKEAADVIESQAEEIENLETGNAILVDMVHRADAEMARLKEEVASLLHRDHQVASMITWLENYQPDVFKRGLWDALPKSPDAVKKPRFEKVYCSQCGGEFGPRDSGYSHCKDHIRDAALAAKSTEHTVSICSAHQTPVVGCPRCHVAVTAAKSPLG